MKKNNNKIILILFIFFILIFSGYILFKYNNSISNTNDETLNKDPIKNTTSKSQNIKKDSTDIFGKYYDKAESLLSSMTLEEKVGQMFLARYPDANTVITEIKSENPGRLHSI